MPLIEKENCYIDYDMIVFPMNIIQNQFVNKWTPNIFLPSKETGFSCGQ